MVVARRDVLTGCPCPSEELLCYKGKVRAEREDISQGKWGPDSEHQWSSSGNSPKELVGSVQVGALSNYKLEYKWKYTSVTARSVESVLWLANILMKWSRNQASILNTLPNIVICCPYKPGLVIKNCQQTCITCFLCATYSADTSNSYDNILSFISNSLFINKEPVALKG